MLSSVGIASGAAATTTEGRTAMELLNGDIDSSMISLVSTEAPPHWRRRDSMSSDGWRVCDELGASAGAAEAMDAADGAMLGGMADDSSGLLFCELLVSIAYIGLVSTSVLESLGA